MPSVNLPLSVIYPPEGPASQQPDGSVSFSATGVPEGNSLFGIGALLAGLDDTAKLFPAVATIEVEVNSGAVWAYLIGESNMPPILSQRRIGIESGRQIDFYVEAVPHGLQLSVNVAEGSPAGVIRRITVRPTTDFDRASVKRIAAANFPEWWYDADLGDGISIKCTVSDTAMVGVRVNSQILHYLLDRTIGDVRGKRGIDIGCSAGYHTFDLARRGANMKAIDLFVRGIEQAQFIRDCNPDKYSNVSIERRSLFSLDPAKEKFDFVWCTGVLYHLSDPLGAVQLIYDICTEGAVIGCCISPADGAVFEMADSGRWGFSQKDEFALVPSASMLRKICERVGFHVVEMVHESQMSVRDDEVRVLPGELVDKSGPVYIGLKK